MGVVDRHDTDVNGVGGSGLRRLRGKKKQKRKPINFWLMWWHGFAKADGRFIVHSFPSELWIQLFKMNS
jgi:hypothetical protein